MLFTSLLSDADRVGDSLRGGLPQHYEKAPAAKIRGEHLRTAISSKEKLYNRAAPVTLHQNTSAMVVDYLLDKAQA